SATPWMMLTSVSSISTTIASNSERAAENFISAVLPDTVDLPGRLQSNPPQVAQFFHRCSLARAAARFGQSLSLRRSFRSRPRQPRVLIKNPDGNDLLTRRRVRSAESLRYHFGAQDPD